MACWWVVQKVELWASVLVEPWVVLMVASTVDGLDVNLVDLMAALLAVPLVGEWVVRMADWTAAERAGDWAESSVSKSAVRMDVKWVVQTAAEWAAMSAFL